MTTPLVTPDSPFIALPRITREGFVGVLRDAGSPWADRAGEVHDLITQGGQDPAVWLAICAQEHSYGTNRDSVLWRNDTRSWTNARTVRDPSLTGWTIVRDAVRRSDYVRYADVLDSVRDGLYRVTDPTYRYVREGRATIAEVLAIWTEGDSEGYTSAVVKRMNGYPSPTVTHGAPRPETEGLFMSRFVDIRALLPRRDRADGVAAGPYERRAIGEKRGVVIHYSGPPVRDRGDTLAVLRAEARYHVGKNWARAGEPPVYGDGLMYHVAIGDDGTCYLCRDPKEVLWHCGAWPQNALALAVHVPIGGKQRATPAQLAALSEVVNAWRSLTGTPVAEVWGHQELSPTDCPGTLKEDFVLPYRAGAIGQRPPASDGSRWFPETGHAIGGAFRAYWEERGGLPIFGYPLTDELLDDGRTVQYFERAVFQWHPDNPDPHKVLLRRLGAEALSRRDA